MITTPKISREQIEEMIDRDAFRDIREKNIALNLLRVLVDLEFAKKGLKFYARKDFYKGGSSSDGDGATAIAYDEGCNAREILAQLEKSGESK